MSWFDRITVSGRTGKSGSLEKPKAPSDGRRWRVSRPRVSEGAALFQPTALTVNRGQIVKSAGLATQ